MKKSLRLHTFFVILTFFLGLSHAVSQYDDPELLQADDLQLQLMDAIQARVEALPASSYPPGGAITDALRLLKKDTTLAFECGTSTHQPPISMVQITVNKTKKIKWNDSLNFNGKHVAIPANACGYFNWTYMTSLEVDPGDPTKRIKKITFDGYFLMDTSIVSPRESSQATALERDMNTVLFYHEMLHCQLMLNAFSNSEWMQAVCNCTVSIAPCDSNHLRIPTLEEGFAGKIFENSPTVISKIMEIPVVPNPDGSFTIPVDIDKDVILYFDALNLQNCIIDSLYTDANNNTMLMGKLIDKTKPGRVFIAIDPENTWYLYGVEMGIVISGVTSIDEPEKLQFSIYPNPARDHVVVNGDFGYPACSEIDISDLLGRVIMKVKVDDFPEKIDVSYLQKGVYFITVRTGKGKGIMKLIIE